MLESSSECIFSHLLRDSTPPFVHPSIHPSVGQSVVLQNELKADTTSAVLQLFSNKENLGKEECSRSGDTHVSMLKNKAGYTASPVACKWAGAVLAKVTRASGLEQ